MKRIVAIILAASALVACDCVRNPMMQCVVNGAD
jgi:hypothetical protein